MEKVVDINPKKSKDKYMRRAFLFVLLSLLSFGVWSGLQIYSMTIDMEEVMVWSEAKIWELEKEIAELKLERRDLTEANENLKESLDEEIYMVESLIDRLEEATGEIDTIRKLEKIDPELLKKYSKVYFLNENYEPAGLVEVPERFLPPTKEEAFFHKQAWPFLLELLEAAEDDGIDPRIVSGYRSFEEQMELKNQYNVIYGAGTANRFSADQGYSEHQLGTAVDFSTGELGGALWGFEKTEFYEWLKENAYRYGFIISYPEGNTSYVFEPWHWRFVGISLASRLNRRGEYFYDMDQRDIDEYRLYLFDR